MVTIDYINRTDGEISKDLKDRIERALEVGLELESVKGPVEVTITFVNSSDIQELNREYRGVDSVTDVLSFPVFTTLEEIWEYPEELPILIGDIVINPQRAAEQASEYGQSEEDEIEYLAIHSLMHLLGYDHIFEDEKSIMRKHEKQVLRKIGAEEFRI